MKESMRKKIGVMAIVETEENKGDDYMVDGLLFCGKCHTPKQVRLTVFGKETVLNCVCECEAKRLGVERKELEKKEHERKIERLRSVGFPDDEMASITFEEDDERNEKISYSAHRYVDIFDDMYKSHKGLLLYGSVGTGKTFISACIANALIDKGVSVLATNFSRLVNKIAGMYEGKQEYLDHLNDFDLLIIDDLGAERDTEYMDEIVQSIIDSRYRSGKPLIVTTNLTAKELKNPLDIRKQRIYSRLFEMCIPIEVKGKDRRKEKLRSGYDELAGLLGL